MTKGKQRFASAISLLALLSAGMAEGYESRVFGEGADESVLCLEGESPGQPQAGGKSEKLGRLGLEPLPEVTTALGRGGDVACAPPAALAKAWGPESLALEFPGFPEAPLGNPARPSARANEGASGASGAVTLGSDRTEDWTGTELTDTLYLGEWGQGMAMSGDIYMLGADDILTLRLNVAMSGDVDLGAGNDVFTFWGKSFTGDLVTGAGNDQINVYNNMGGDFRLSGHDTLTTGNGATYSGTVHGTAGNDIFLIDSDGTVGTVPANTAKLVANGTGTFSGDIIGNGGTNSVLVSESWAGDYTAGSGANSVQVSESWTGDYIAGGGTDKITISSGKSYRGTVRGTAGSDSITLAGEGLVFAIVELGAGDDSVIWKGSGGRYAYMNGGLGANTLAVDENYEGSYYLKAAVRFAPDPAGEDLPVVRIVDGVASDTITVAEGKVFSGNIFGTQADDIVVIGGDGSGISTPAGAARIVVGGAGSFTGDIRDLDFGDNTVYVNQNYSGSVVSDKYSPYHGGAGEPGTTDTFAIAAGADMSGDIFLNTYGSGETLRLSGAGTFSGNLRIKTNNARQANVIYAMTGSMTGKINMEFYHVAAPGDPVNPRTVFLSVQESMGGDVANSLTSNSLEIDLASGKVFSGDIDNTGLLRLSGAGRYTGDVSLRACCTNEPATGDKTAANIVFDGSLTGSFEGAIDTYGANKIRLSADTTVGKGIFLKNKLKRVMSIDAPISSDSSVVTLTADVTGSDSRNSLEIIGRVKLVGDVSLGAGNDYFRYGATGGVDGTVDLGSGANHFDILEKYGKKVVFTPDFTVRGRDSMSVGTNAEMSGDILGGASSDTFTLGVESGGAMSGDVRLGGGDDSFTYRAVAGTFTGSVDMGTGANTVTLEQSASFDLSLKYTEKDDPGSDDPSKKVLDKIARDRLHIAGGRTMSGSVTGGKYGDVFSISGYGDMTGSISLGGGDDTFSYGLVGGSLSPNNLSLGTGANILNVNQTWTGNLAVEYTEKDDPDSDDPADMIADQIARNTINVASGKDFVGNFTGSKYDDVMAVAGAGDFAGSILGGAGDDTVTIDGSVSFTSGLVDVGEGDDRVVWSTTGAAHNNLKIRFGAGSKTFSLEESYSREIVGSISSPATATLDVSAGKTFSGEFHGNWTLNGSDDTLTMTGAGSVSGKIALGNVLHAGWAHQTLSKVDDGEDVVNYRMTGSFTGSLELGVGANVLNLHEDFGGDFDTQGNDTINISAGKAMSGDITSRDIPSLDKNREGELDSVPSLSLTLAGAGSMTGDIDTGSGDDTINFGLAGGMTGELGAGAGSNTISMTESFAGNLRMAGTDTLTIASGKTFSGSVVGTSSADLVIIGPATSSASATSKLTVGGAGTFAGGFKTGGAGAGSKDTLLISPGVTVAGDVSGASSADTLDLPGQGTLSGDIDLGGGANALSLSGGWSGEYAGGAGADTIKLVSSSSASIALSSLNLGAGTNRLLVLGMAGGPGSQSISLSLSTGPADGAASDSLYLCNESSNAAATACEASSRISSGAYSVTLDASGSGGSVWENIYVRNEPSSAQSELTVKGSVALSAAELNNFMLKGDGNAGDELKITGSYEIQGTATNPVTVFELDVDIRTGVADGLVFDGATKSSGGSFSKIPVIRLSAVSADSQAGGDARLELVTVDTSDSDVTGIAIQGAVTSGSVTTRELNGITWTLKSLASGNLVTHYLEAPEDSETINPGAPGSGCDSTPVNLGGGRNKLTINAPWCGTYTGGSGADVIIVTSTGVALHNATITLGAGENLVLGSGKVETELNLGDDNSVVGGRLGSASDSSLTLLGNVDLGGGTNVLRAATTMGFRHGEEGGTVRKASITGGDGSDTIHLSGDAGGAISLGGGATSNEVTVVGTISGDVTSTATGIDTVSIGGGSGSVSLGNGTNILTVMAAPGPQISSGPSGLGAAGAASAGVWSGRYGTCSGTGASISCLDGTGDDTITVEAGASMTAAGTLSLTAGGSNTVKGAGRISAALVFGSGGDTVGGAAGSAADSALALASVDLGEGDNTMRAASVSGDIVAGSGIDVINLSGTAAGSVTLGGGEGSNTLVVGEVVSGDITSEGTGTDTVTIGGGSGNISLGDGANVLTLLDPNSAISSDGIWSGLYGTCEVTGGSATCVDGSGDDTIVVGKGTRMTGLGTLSFTAGGVNTVRGEGSISTALVFGAAGDVIGGAEGSNDSKLSLASVSLGDGDNTMRATTASGAITGGAGVDLVYITGNVGGAVDLKGGARNVLGVGGTVGGNVSSAASGTGSDKDAFTTRAISGNVSLGGGENELTVTGAVSGTITVGDGKDTIEVTGDVDGAVALGGQATDNSLAIGGILDGGLTSSATGTDTVSLGGLSGTRAVSLGGGANILTVSGAWAGTYSGGPGADTITLAPGADESVALSSVDAGGGANKIFVRGVSGGPGTGSVSLSLSDGPASGAGSDTIFLCNESSTLTGCEPDSGISDGAYSVTLDASGVRGNVWESVQVVNEPSSEQSQLMIKGDISLASPKLNNLKIKADGSVGDSLTVTGTYEIQGTAASPVTIFELDVDVERAQSDTLIFDGARSASGAGFSKTLIISLNSVTDVKIAGDDARLELASVYILNSDIEGIVLQEQAGASGAAGFAGAGQDQTGYMLNGRPWELKSTTEGTVQNYYLQAPPDIVIIDDAALESDLDVNLGGGTNILRVLIPWTGAYTGGMGNDTVVVGAAGVVRASAELNLGAGDNAVKGAGAIEIPLAFGDGGTVVGGAQGSAVDSALTLLGNVSLGDGANVLRAKTTAGTLHGTSTAVSATITGGSGSDTIVLTGDAGGAINLGGGSGNNSLTVGGTISGDVSSQSTGRNDISIGGGSGNVSLGSGTNTLTLTDPDSSSADDGVWSGGYGICNGTGASAICVDGTENDRIVVEAGASMTGAGTLYLTGGGRNEILGAGSVSTTLVFGNGNDTVGGASGSASDSALSLGDVTLGGGNNTLRARSAGAITAGSGIDIIELTAGASGAIDLGGGSGNNTLTAGGTVSGDITSAADGTDTVTIGGGAGDISLGGGSNALTLSDPDGSVDDDGIWSGRYGTCSGSGASEICVDGSGSDRIVVEAGASMTGPGTLSLTGGGRNEVMGAGSISTALVFGDGDDTVGGASGSATESALSLGNVTLGGGSNTLRARSAGAITAGSGIDVIELTAGASGAVSLGGGSGSNTLTAGGAVSGDITSTADGTDTVTIGGGSGNISLGDGANVLTLTGPNSAVSANGIWSGLYGTCSGSGASASCVDGSGDDTIVVGEGASMTGLGTLSFTAGGANAVRGAGSISAALVFGSGGDTIGGAAGSDDSKLSLTAVSLGDGDNTMRAAAASGAITGGSGIDLVTMTRNVGGAIDLKGGARNALDVGGTVGGNVSSAASGTGSDKDVFKTGTVIGSVSLGGGENELTVGGAVSGAITVGDGKDTIKLTGNAGGAVELGGGAADNSLTIGGILSGDLTSSATGADTVSLGGLSGTRAVSLGGGANALTVSGAWAGTYSGGSGADTITLAPGAGESVTLSSVDAGAGENRLFVRGAAGGPGTGSVFLSLSSGPSSGAGSDSIYLCNESSSATGCEADSGVSSGAYRVTLDARPAAPSEGDETLAAIGQGGGVWESIHVVNEASSAQSELTVKGGVQLASPRLNNILVAGDGAAGDSIAITGTYEIQGTADSPVTIFELDVDVSAAASDTLAFTSASAASDPDPNPNSVDFAQAPVIRLNPLSAEALVGSIERLDLVTARDSDISGIMIMGARQSAGDGGAIVTTVELGKRNDDEREEWVLKEEVSGAGVKTFYLEALPDLVTIDQANSPASVNLGGGTNELVVKVAWAGSYQGGGGADTITVSADGVIQSGGSIGLGAGRNAVKGAGQIEAPIALGDEGGIVGGAAGSASDSALTLLGNVTLGGGINVLRAKTTSGTLHGTSTAASATITGGAGSDTVVLTGDAGGAINLGGGDTDNTLAVGGAIAGDVDSAATGTDTVTIGGGAGSVRLGGGANILTITDPDSSDSTDGVWSGHYGTCSGSGASAVCVDGSGSDTIVVQAGASMTAPGKLSLTGSGQNTVRGAGRISTALEFGDGNDTIGGASGSASDSALELGDVTLGDGSNTLRARSAASITGGSGIDIIELAEVGGASGGARGFGAGGLGGASGAIDLGGGETDNTLTVDGGIGGDVTSAATGTDTVTIGGGSGSVSLGGGANILTLSSGAWSGHYGTCSGSGASTSCVDGAGDDTIVVRAGASMTAPGTLSFTAGGSNAVRGAGTISTALVFGSGNDTIGGDSDEDSLNGLALGSVTLGDGNNTARMASAASITGGSGEDRIYVSGGVTGAINLGGGQTNNTLELSGALGGDVTSAATGTDTVSIAGGAGGVNLGGGANTLTVSGDWTGTYDGAGGIDTLAIGAQATTGAGALRLGAGNDILRGAAGGAGKVAGTVEMGAGDDRIGGNAGEANLNGLVLAGVDLGDGSNTARMASAASVTGGSGIDLVYVSGSVSGAVDLKGGARNILDVTGTIGGDVSSAAAGTGASRDVFETGAIGGNVDLGGGENELTVSGGVTGTITLGSGKDTVTVSGGAGGAINLGGGATDNTLTVTGILGGKITSSATGTDTISIAGGSAGVDLGGGANTLTVSGDWTGAYDGAGGVDTLAIGSGAATGAGRLRLGEGSDILRGAGKVTGAVEMGAGDDRIGGNAGETSLNSLALGSVDLGAGANVMRTASAAGITAGDGLDTIHVSGDVTGAVGLGGGISNNSLTIGGILGGDLTSSATGTDTVSLGGVSGTRAISLGGGANVLSVDGAWTGTYSGGSGDDTITLAPASGESMSITSLNPGSGTNRLFIRGVAGGPGDGSISLSLSTGQAGAGSDWLYLCNEGSSATGCAADANVSNAAYSAELDAAGGNTWENLVIRNEESSVQSKLMIKGSATLSGPVFGNMLVQSDGTRIGDAITVTGTYAMMGAFDAGDNDPVTVFSLDVDVASATADTLVFRGATSASGSGLSRIPVIKLNPVTTAAIAGGDARLDIVTVESSDVTGISFSDPRQVLENGETKVTLNDVEWALGQSISGSSTTYYLEAASDFVVLDRPEDSDRDVDLGGGVNAITIKIPWTGSYTGGSGPDAVIVSGEGVVKRRGEPISGGVRLALGGGRNTLRGDGTVEIEVQMGDGDSIVGGSSGAGASARGGAGARAQGDNSLVFTRDIDLGDGDNTMRAAQTKGITGGSGIDMVYVSGNVTGTVDLEGGSRNLLDVGGTVTGNIISAATGTGDSKDDFRAGAINGAVNLGGGENELTVSGGATGSITLGGGKDTVSIGGGSASVSPGGGANTLTISSGEWTGAYTDGADSDTIVVDSGARIGAGSGDPLSLSGGANRVKGAGEVNRIVEFGAGGDTIGINPGGADGDVSTADDNPSSPEIDAANKLGFGAEVRLGGGANKMWAASAFGITGGSGADLIDITGNVNGNISLGDGGDSLAVGGNVTGSVSLGGGSDTATIKGNVTLGVDLGGGSGNKTLVVEGAIEGGISSSGTGRDTVSVEGLGGDVNLGGGENILTINSGTWAGAYTDGADSDTIEVAENAVIGAASQPLSLGSGANSIRGAGAINRAVEFGGGNDVIGIDPVGASQGLAEEANALVFGAAVSLGEGNNRMWAAGAAGITAQGGSDSVHLSGSVTGGINLGGGENSLTVAGDWRGAYTGGAGSDTVTLASSSGKSIALTGFSAGGGSNSIIVKGAPGGPGAGAITLSLPGGAGGGSNSIHLCNEMSSGSGCLAERTIVNGAYSVEINASASGAENWGNVYVSNEESRARSELTVTGAVTLERPRLNNFLVAGNAAAGDSITLSGVYEIKGGAGSPVTLFELDVNPGEGTSDILRFKGAAKAPGTGFSKVPVVDVKAVPSSSGISDSQRVDLVEVDSASDVTEIAILGGTVNAGGQTVVELSSETWFLRQRSSSGGTMHYLEVGNQTIVVGGPGNPQDRTDTLDAGPGENKLIIDGPWARSYAGGDSVDLVIITSRGVATGATIDLKGGSNVVRGCLDGERLKDDLECATGVNAGSGRFEAPNVIIMGDGNDIIGGDDGQADLNGITLNTVQLGGGDNTVRAKSATGAITAGSGRDIIHLSGDSAAVSLGGGETDNDLTVVGSISGNVTSEATGVDTVSIGAGTGDVNLGGGENAFTVTGAVSGGWSGTYHEGAGADDIVINGLATAPLTLAAGANTLKGAGTIEGKVTMGAGDDVIGAGEASLSESRLSLLGGVDLGGGKNTMRAKSARGAVSAGDGIDTIHLSGDYLSDGAGGAIHLGGGETDNTLTVLGAVEGGVESAATGIDTVSIGGGAGSVSLGGGRNELSVTGSWSGDYTDGAGADTIVAEAGAELTRPLVLAAGANTVKGAGRILAKVTFGEGADTIGGASISDAESGLSLGAVELGDGDNTMRAKDSGAITGGSGADIIETSGNIGGTVDLKGGSMNSLNAGGIVDGGIFSEAEGIGQSGDVFTALGVRGQVSMGGGDNALTVGGDVGGQVTGGDGQDDIEVTGSVLGGISLGGGSTDNSLSVEGAVGGDITSGATGRDRVSVGSMSVTAAINLGGGENELEVGGYWSGTYEGGSGPDTVTLTSSWDLLVSLTSISAGEGANRLFVRGVPGGAGNGNVSLSLAGPAPATGSNEIHLCNELSDGTGCLADDDISSGAFSVSLNARGGSGAWDSVRISNEPSSAQSKVTVAGSVTLIDPRLNNLAFVADGTPGDLIRVTTSPGGGYEMLDFSTQGSAPSGTLFELDVNAGTLEADILEFATATSAAGDSLVRRPAIRLKAAPGQQAAASGRVEIARASASDIEGIRIVGASGSGGQAVISLASRQWALESETRTGVTTWYLNASGGDIDRRVVAEDTDNQEDISFGDGVNRLVIDGIWTRNYTGGKDEDTIIVTSRGEAFGTLDLGDGNNFLTGCAFNPVYPDECSGAEGNEGSGKVPGKVIMGAGDDTIGGSETDVLLNGLELGPVELGDGVNTVRAKSAGRLTGGSNTDTIILSGGASGDMDLKGGLNSLTIGGVLEGEYSGGDGNDSITLMEGARITGVITLMGGANSITGSSGDDSVVVGEGLGIVDLGGGSNVLAVAGAWSGTYEDGPDTDTIRIRPAGRLAVNLSLEEGSNALEGTGSLAVNARFGSGDDRVGIDPAGPDGLAGTGADNPSDAAVAAANALVFEGEVNLGDGSNRLWAEGISAGGSIIGGEGSDMIHLSGDAGGPIDLGGGAGDNTLTVAGSLAAAVTGGTHSGRDSVSIGGGAGSVSLGRGSNQLIAGGSWSGTYTGGSNSDTVLLRDVGAVEVNMGIGTNRLFMEGVPGGASSRASLSLHTATGPSDSLVICNGAIDIDTGACGATGDNRSLNAALDASAGNGWETINVQNLENSGQSSLSVSGAVRFDNARFGNMTVSAGAGGTGDSIEVSGSYVLAGNSVFELYADTASLAADSLAFLTAPDPRSETVAVVSVQSAADHPMVASGQRIDIVTLKPSTLSKVSVQGISDREVDLNGQIWVLGSEARGNDMSYFLESTDRLAPTAPETPIVSSEVQSYIALALNSIASVSRLVASQPIAGGAPAGRTRPWTQGGGDSGGEEPGTGADPISSAATFHLNITAGTQTEEPSQGGSGGKNYSHSFQLMNYSADLHGGSGDMGSLAHSLFLQYGTQESNNLLESTLASVGYGLELRGTTGLYAGVSVAGRRVSGSRSAAGSLGGDFDMTGVSTAVEAGWSVAATDRLFVMPAARVSRSSFSETKLSGGQAIAGFSVQTADVGLMLSYSQMGYDFSGASAPVGSFYGGAVLSRDSGVQFDGLASVPGIDGSSRSWIGFDAGWSRRFGDGGNLFLEASMAFTSGGEVDGNARSYTIGYDLDW